MAIQFQTARAPESSPVRRLIIVRRGAVALYDELCTKWWYHPGTIVMFDRRLTPRLPGRADGQRRRHNSDILRERGFYVQRLVVTSSPQ